MLAYHGSKADLHEHLSNNGVLEPSVTGSFGAGIYLADKEAAQNYALDGHVCEFEIDTAHLLTCEADFDVAEAFDLDTAALPLICQLYGVSLAIAAAIFHQLSKGDLLLGAVIQEKATSMGYRGLLMDYGNCFEVVVFDAAIMQYIGQLSKVTT